MISLPSDSHRGKRVVPSVIDEIATHDPERIYAVIPKTSNLGDGFRDVTFLEFAAAINRMAWWLEKSLGKSSTFDTITYFGPSDFAYWVVVTAAGKVGYKTLLSSPRNSTEIHLHLFKLTNVKTILTSKSFPISSELESQSGLPIIQVSTLQEILSDSSKATPYPFAKTYEEAKNDPFLILHSSGSTGFPKPITIKHGWISTVDNVQDAPLFHGYPHLFKPFMGKRVLNSLPTFHAAGMFMGLVGATFWDSVMIWNPADRFPDAALMNAMLDSVHIDVGFMVPFVLEEMIENPASLEKLSKLEAIIYGGTPLSRESGNLACQKLNLLNGLGATEIGILPGYLKDREDWEYFHFSTDLRGIELRDIGDGLHELVMVRDAATERFHSAFWTYPDAKEYSMNDIYEKHPTKSNLWLHVGRLDDVIVLKDGKKVSPTSLESSLRKHPCVDQALIVGNGRAYIAAILQFVPNVEERLGSFGNGEEWEKVLEDVWEVVESINRSTPVHARLDKKRIGFSRVDRPFELSLKGVVKRSVTEKMYEEEIRELYER